MSSAIWLLPPALYLLFLLTPLQLHLRLRWQGGSSPRLVIRWWRLERRLPPAGRGAGPDKAARAARHGGGLWTLPRRLMRKSMARYGVLSILMPAYAAGRYMLSRLVCRKLAWRSRLAGQPPHRAAPLAPALWACKHALVKLAGQQGLALRGRPFIQVDPALGQGAPGRSTMTLRCTVILRPLHLTLAFILAVCVWVRQRLASA